jgi:asparagine synthase (glutamine-hydrolysing)
MCGITGFWAQADRHDRLRSELSEAVGRLRHRGPDDHGIWLNDTGVGLGHTRLSILDLSDAAHQPMVSADENHVVVFNGEIYNFGEIRTELESLGHTFRGTGDTEVILKSFIEWGSDAVKRFIGMFAIAIWNEREQTMELVRDRVGVKPLHFGWDGKILVFGSELKAIRAFSHWNPEIDPQALGEYLQYGYISNSRTIYKAIHKLPPGNRLILSGGRDLRIERYWSAHDSVGTAAKRNDAEIEADLEDLLTDSFQYRMVSDVPVGVFLSGGVDSSLVTALLAKQHNHEIRTFTIGFGEDQFDESHWAKKVAHHCGTTHTEYTLGVSEALDIARNWGNLFDEPFGDASGIPTLLVSRLASREVKVVLSADGGDELFSGYKVYGSVLERLDQLNRLPRWLTKISAASLSLLAPRLDEARNGGISVPARLRGSWHRRADRLRMMLERPTAGCLMDIYSSYWKPSEINRLIGRYEPPRSSADSYIGNPATQISLWDFCNYLPEDILTKVDRTTMHVSIEGREPILDHRLVEFAFALPPHLRRGTLGPKHILKSILYRHVPRELVDRPKQGFGIPLESWLRTELKPLVLELLDETRIENAGIMDAPMVRRLVTNFYSGDRTLSYMIWFLLAFEMWRENWK